MRPLKSALRHRWIEYLRSELQSHTSGSFKLSPPNRFDLVDGLRKCKIIDGSVDADDGNDCELDAECAAVLDTKSYNMIE
ncbi:hypothetical protein H310_08647 [Aphanomyces invadans]|uniref:Uncharacterized protein n=1 Tax=Aphanomyces invadans TaxID=157072 RepID=A0A024TWW9_9STRA|nr:hypothetical protein H310_08647 [Aphanomyces invadans]ETV98508.1 hypothetical protein H310_08647 [Aphanomyces invadans]|eukprot:XP_008872705.1 hypothetical protein H310_08647 [Aphanomyces invadans]